MKTILLILFVILFIHVAEANTDECYSYAQNKPIKKVAYSFKENLLILQNDNNLRLLDTATKYVTVISPIDTKVLNYFDYSENLNEVAYLIQKYDRSYEYHLYNLPNQKDKRIILEKTQEKEYFDFAISFDHRFIIMSGDKNHIYIFRGNDGKLLKDFDMESGLWAYSFFLEKNSNKYIATQDKHSYVYDLEKLSLISSFKSLSYPDAKYFFFNDDSTVCQYDPFGNLHLYNYITGSYIEYIFVNLSTAHIFLSKNDSLILIQGDKQFDFYNLKKKEYVRNVLNMKYNFIKTSEFYEEENMLFFFHYVSGFYSYNLKTNNLKNDYYYDLTDINQDIYFLKDNELFDVLGNMKLSKSVRLLNYSNCNSDTYTLSIPLKIYQVLSDFNEYAAIDTSKPKTIFLYDVNSNDKKAEYDLKDTVKNLRFSNDKKYLYVFTQKGNEWDHILYSVPDLNIIYETTNSWGFYFSDNTEYFFSFDYPNSRIYVNRCSDGSNLFEIECNYSYGSFFSDKSTYFYNVINIDKNSSIVSYKMPYGSVLDTINIADLNLEWPFFVYEDYNQLIGKTKRNSFLSYDLLENKITKEIFFENYPININELTISKDKRFAAAEFQDGTIGIKKINGILSVKNQKEQLVEYYFSISPNPATDYIEIAFDNHALNGAVKNVKIYDVLGIEHPVSFSATPLSEGNLRLDVSNLPAGVYFVRVGGQVLQFVKM